MLLVPILVITKLKLELTQIVLTKLKILQEQYIHQIQVMQMMVD